MGWRIETMTVSEKPARRRRKLWIILGAVVIAAVAVVGSLAYVSNRPGAASLPTVVLLVPTEPGPTRQVRELSTLTISILMVSRGTSSSASPSTSQQAP